MLVRTLKQDERIARWRRPARGGHDTLPGADIAETETSPAPRERRQGGPSQDRALYTCECGYAFEALVTTSVGCPHCARTQAW
jgi:hypothetical protein